MAENKTKPTDASVEDYIASRANAQQRTDCRELMVLFKRVTRGSPRMWGPSIVGYGSYRYTYESGRTGEAPLAGCDVSPGGSPAPGRVHPSGGEGVQRASGVRTGSRSLLRERWIAGDSDFSNLI